MNFFQVGSRAIDNINYSKKTPLAITVLKGNLIKTEILISKGANINDSGNDHFSLLSIAIAKQNSEMVSKYTIENQRHLHMCYLFCTCNAYCT